MLGGERVLEGTRGGDLRLTVLIPSGYSEERAVKVDEGKKWSDGSDVSDVSDKAWEDPEEAQVSCRRGRRK
jgi:hypothetical protein